MSSDDFQYLNIVELAKTRTNNIGLISGNARFTQVQNSVCKGSPTSLYLSNVFDIYLSIFKPLELKQGCAFLILHVLIIFAKYVLFCDIV